MSLKFHHVGFVSKVSLMRKVCKLFVQLQVLPLFILVTDHLASPVPVMMQAPHLCDKSDDLLAVVASMIQILYN